MPTVDAMFADLYRDVSADYYGIVNSDILMSDSVFSALDVVDAMAKNGTISNIVGVEGCRHAIERNRGYRARY